MPGGGDPRPAILKCSHIPIKKESGRLCVEVPVLVTTPEVWAQSQVTLGVPVLPGGGILLRFLHLVVKWPALEVPVLMGSPDVQFRHVVRWPSVRKTHLYGNLPYPTMS
jgi:hypothetical protein